MRLYVRSVPTALAVSLFATAAQGAVLGTIQVDTGKYVSGNLPKLSLFFPFYHPLR
jgi:hypothetical protein